MKAVAASMLMMTVMCTAGCSKSYDSKDYVDLGLPSGLLWGTRNVGAESSEDYGSYFLSGDATPKSVSNRDTYVTLKSGDDAATASWGDGARTPTVDEWQELSEHCTFVWTTLNGVNGIRLTGSNGNSLFLPAAGCRANDMLVYAGDYGYYLSSTLDTHHQNYAWCFHFYPDFANMTSGNMDFAFSVRPVRKR